MNYDETVEKLRADTLHDGKERVAFCDSKGRCSEIHVGSAHSITWPTEEVNRINKGKYVGTIHTHPGSNAVTFSLVDLQSFIANPFKWAEVIIVASGRVCRVSKKFRLKRRDSPMHYYADGIDESPVLREKVIKKYAERNGIKYTCRQIAAPAENKEDTTMAMKQYKEKLSKEAQAVVDGADFNDPEVLELLGHIDIEGEDVVRDVETGLVMNDEQKRLYAARIKRFNEEGLPPFLDDVLMEIEREFWGSIRASIKAATGKHEPSVGVRAGWKIVVLKDVAAEWAA